MKKILGIDLGITSIGWALIEENETERKILGLGSRIIPLSTDDKDEFSSGNKISKNQKRTLRRTQRKGYDRYQLRRRDLKEALSQAQMLPTESEIKLPALILWELRAKAVSQKISLTELGRILLHLNQKRGYKSSRSDATLDKKDTAYVEEVKSRHQIIKDEKKTIGQFFYEKLQHEEHYKIKQQVFPREAYIEEFDAICQEQQKHYPQILSADFIKKLRNEIIYYQRKLKSQKGLVSVCELEGFYTTKEQNDKEKVYFVGPRVSPRSSPLFQVAKIWENVNNISIKNKRNEFYAITQEKKWEVFNYLDQHERLSEVELFKILGLKKGDGWYGNKQTSKGLQGNLTKAELLKFLDKDSQLLQFELGIEKSEKETYLLDRKTGEITGSDFKKEISADIEKQPLYQLWHTIYSISDVEECALALMKRFNIGEEIAFKLAGIDFARTSFGNKSIKAIRKVLPYLMDGYIYSDAACLAGYNHSNSLTKDEQLKRKLLDKIPNLPKNSLRQPVVEKILNQLINLVNSVIDVRQGWISEEEREKNQFEIRIELARELKQSKDERNDTFTNLTKRERENETIRKRIDEDYKQFGVRATRVNIIKWRLFQEINNHESKLNAFCIYCGQAFGLTEALRGSNIDIEHIIPRSLLFDDSQSNKTLCHRKCNEDKKNFTAFDFMKSKSDEQFNEYLERVDILYKSRIIGKSKRDKLLMTASNIPNNFIDRQLRETQYIAKKSREILEQICRSVWSTSGSVTSYLRDKWGWDDVTMNLQLSKYRDLGLTEWKEWETNDGQKHKKEIIKNWSKRDDHRHHAIDALTIACTQQGFIQRMNTLSAQHTRDEMFAEVEKQSIQFRDRLALLDRYIIGKRPFTTKQVEDAVEKILVSLKAGKKVATLHKYKATGKNLSKGVLVPRGALSEESVYGKIRTIEKGKSVKYLFENPNLIFKQYIKAIIEERLSKYGNDAKKAVASLKKDPIYLDSAKTKLLEYATCYKDAVVLKYPIGGIKAKDVQYIIDNRVRQIIKARLELYSNNEKEAFKDLDKNPVWFNEEKKIPIKAVRMITGLSAVESVKKNEAGESIGFVKPGNNHHIAIYIDEHGKKHEHVCTFWHAVERKKNNVPIVIKNPSEVWTTILESKDKNSQEFLSKLPKDKWIFIESLQQNEMFILGMNTQDFNQALSNHNYKAISRHLYRVQKITSSDYYFRSHLETELDDSEESKKSKRYYRFKSIGAFENLNPKKVVINNLGNIVQ
jgi:CRISPR-associated endonuclease Csn1